MLRKDLLRTWPSQNVESPWWLETGFRKSKLLEGPGVPELKELWEAEEKQSKRGSHDWGELWFPSGFPGTFWNKRWTFLMILPGFLGNRDAGRRKSGWRERRVISAINYISTTDRVSAPGLKKHSFGTTIKVLNSMLHKSGQWNENSFSIGTRRQRVENFLCRLLQPSWKSPGLWARVEDGLLVIVVGGFLCFFFFFP